ncbi:hypothetical protein GP486_007148 [Trichoglossum hirsutum]|uniref:Uncharacterized protein n=1 Tax=Trichoglossum hirsutum TaxID=265104 RepID=A0A9P8ICG1_9PEZI|nr:hypothetical protein GP486_007148 [Trichoglossum hirsutum]
MGSEKALLFGVLMACNMAGDTRPVLDAVRAVVVENEQLKQEVDSLKRALAEAKEKAAESRSRLRESEEKWARFLEEITRYGKMAEDSDKTYGNQD